MWCCRGSGLLASSILSFPLVDVCTTAGPGDFPFLFFSFFIFIFLAPFKVEAVRWSMWRQTERKKKKGSLHPKGCRHLIKLMGWTLVLELLLVVSPDSFCSYRFRGYCCFFLVAGGGGVVLESNIVDVSFFVTIIDCFGCFLHCCCHYHSRSLVGFVLVFLMLLTVALT